MVSGTWWYSGISEPVWTGAGVWDKAVMMKWKTIQEGCNSARQCDLRQGNINLIQWLELRCRLIERLGVYQTSAVSALELIDHRQNFTFRIPFQSATLSKIFEMPELRYIELVRLLMSLEVSPLFACVDPTLHHLILRLRDRHSPKSCHPQSTTPCQFIQDWVQL